MCWALSRVMAVFDLLFISSHWHINSVRLDLWSGTLLSGWLADVWTVPIDEPNRAPELTCKCSWTESQSWEESFDMYADCAVHMHRAHLPGYSSLSDEAVLIIMAVRKWQLATYCPYITFLHLTGANSEVKLGMLRLRKCQSWLNPQKMSVILQKSV